MNYLIVDDEPIAHRILEGYCNELPHFRKVGNAYNALEAASILKNQKIDLIFLDINMPKISGFDWLKTLRNPPKIIVTTAYQEYALEGYELDVLDYLLKPFSLARFLKALNKIDKNEYKQVSENNASTGKKDHQFFLKGDKKYHQINLDDILYIEASGNYCKVYLEEKMIMTHEKISVLETLLPNEDFLRVHKSFIIATDKIEIIQGNQIYIQKNRIPIGQTYKIKINKLLDR